MDDRQSRNTAKLKIAIGGFNHETNVYIDKPTDISHFNTVISGDDLVDELKGVRSSIGGLLQGAYSCEWLIVPTIYAAATPSGIVTRETYDTISAKLTDGIKKACPLDGVLLALHGAMVVEGLDDPEGDILSRVRNIVGEDVPIVAELDMHANVSELMVKKATVLVGYQTNPHIDTFEKGIEASNLLYEIIKNRIKPTTAYIKLPLILSPEKTGTKDYPLKPALEVAEKIKAGKSILSVSIFSGFAYCDTPFTGVSVTVTSNSDPELAERYAKEFADVIMSHMEETAAISYPVGEAVRMARELGPGPVLLVDSADNIGGGTPGDGVVILKAMLDADVQEGAIIVADPGAVAVCWDAGEGAEVTLEVGGKSDIKHGPPVKVSGQVMKLSDGVFVCENKDNHFSSSYGSAVDMGRTVWLRSGAVNIVLTEKKTPPLDLAQFRFLGIQPEEQSMIVVKGAVAHRAAYLPIASGEIYLQTPGACPTDLRTLNYKKVRHPIFPLDNKVPWEFSS